MMNRYIYEYDADTMRLDRWNAKTEKYGVVKGIFGNVHAAKRAAQADYTRLKNLRTPEYGLFNSGVPGEAMVYLD